MKIDLDECVVKSPEGEERNKLYKMLGEVFAIETKLFNDAIEGKFKFCNWTPFSLYYGDEVAGNVSIIKMQIWLGGKIIDLYGIGSVATPEKFRKNGIAKHLMAHSLNEIDKLNLPSVLFTDLPKVYESHGFKTVHQEYRMFDITNVKAISSNQNIEYIEEINNEILTEIRDIYENSCQNFDGKFVRGDQKLSNMKKLYNPKKSQIIASQKDGKICGYIKADYDKDRITLTEFCCDINDTETRQSLIAAALNAADKHEVKTISLAFAPSHFIWNVLENNETKTEVEEGAQREVFMVRGPHGNTAGALENLFWSLADKF